ncbi:hypothetical protein JW758_01970 [Candidatus Peregrinibacteria bacterium]|nr:hypothetical protein [Candidatus Peregrinibacteria bacterium]
MEDVKKVNDTEELIQKEEDGKRYLVVSFMFVVFFMASLRDAVSAAVNNSGVFLGISFMLIFIVAAGYFFFQANNVLDDDEKDKLDVYRESLSKQEVEGVEKKKPSLMDKMYTNVELSSLKRVYIVLSVIVFLFFMSITVLTAKSTPVEDADAKATTQTVNTKAVQPGAVVPAKTTVK